jgi:uncharacterized membrane protein
MTGISARRLLSILTVFVAASAAGALVKIPSPLGSIALDSLPGYFSAAFYGPLVGALVGSVGHIASAATSGFPLGVLHIAVAVQMVIWCSAYGMLIRAIDKTWAVWVAAAVAILLNGLAAPFMLVPFGLPMDVAKVLWPFLLAASALNVVLASVALVTAGRLTGPRA